MQRITEFRSEGEQFGLSATTFLWF